MVPHGVDRVGHRLRAKHHSLRTEEAYLHRVRRFIRFHRRQHPRDLDAHHIREVLTHLARDRQVSASTQNQALASLLFLYEMVPNIPMAVPLHFLQATRPLRLPVALMHTVIGKASWATWRQRGRLLHARYRMPRSENLTVIAA